MASAAAPAGPGEVVLLAGGDLELGRATGKRLLREPGFDPLAPLDAWLQPADVRFVNLESQLSEQGGETISSRNSLVFTGPPIGADALARARVDVVSTANNHAWDYGKRALLETLDNLDRVRVAHVGTGRDLAQAHAPVIVERKGLRLGFLAATDIWNQGSLATHEGRHFVAAADPGWMLPAIRELRPQVDVLIVSYHGGDEYHTTPLPRAQKFHSAALEAGADLILGHHPHVLQGVAFAGTKPIFYSLGNLLMQMHKDHPWTGVSLVTRLHLRRGQPTRVAVCPFRIVGLTPRPLFREPDAAAQWAMFAAHFKALSASVIGGAALGPMEADGCAWVTAR